MNWMGGHRQRLTDRQRFGSSNDNNNDSKQR
jgi:hypothetical protein